MPSRVVPCIKKAMYETLGICGQVNITSSRMIEFYGGIEQFKLDFPDLFVTFNPTTGFWYVTRKDA